MTEGLGHDLIGAVGRSVVDHQDGNLDVPAGQKAVQGAPDHRRLVIGGDQDIHARQGGGRIDRLRMPPTPRGQGQHQNDARQPQADGQVEADEQNHPDRMGKSRKRPSQRRSATARPRAGPAWSDPACAPPGRRWWSGDSRARRASISAGSALTVADRSPPASCSRMAWPTSAWASTSDTISSGRSRWVPPFASGRTRFQSLGSMDSPAVV